MRQHLLCLWVSQGQWLQVVHESGGGVLPMLHAPPPLGVRVLVRQVPVLGPSQVALRPHLRV